MTNLQYWTRWAIAISVTLLVARVLLVNPIVSALTKNTEAIKAMGSK